jgi:hypothetical protein
MVLMVIVGEEGDAVMAKMPAWKTSIKKTNKVIFVFMFSAVS